MRRILETTVSLIDEEVGNYTVNADVVIHKYENHKSMFQDRTSVPWTYDIYLDIDSNDKLSEELRALIADEMGSRAHKKLENINPIWTEVD